MREESPSLPTRAPHNLAMAATVRLWQTGQVWVADDPAILRRLVDGLRALPADPPTGHCCCSREPIRGFAHAHRLMDVHAGHRCPRFDTAADYAAEGQR